MLISCALVALAATTVGAVKSLVAKGNAFVDPDSGNKFQVVGMAYQPGGSAGYKPKQNKDPLSDPDACRRDAALMQILGINTIRVYNLDPYANHDECASIFNAAGMYMAIDVNSPLVGEAIASFEPWTTYYAKYLEHVFANIEAFSGYPNTLLFFSANEVINDVKSAEFAPQYLRAVTRDMKNYIKNNIKRQIPVGYSAADVRPVLFDTYNYMECALDGDEGDMSRADLFAMNSYSWCGPKTTFETSTYEDLVDGFKDTSIPVFFSEYGCIKPKPRYWNETESIYGDDMMDVMSGGIVYEWTFEDNGYGLITLDGDTAKISGDYNRLKNHFADLDWESIQSQKPGKTPSVQSCKSSLIKNKGFDSNFTLPDVPPGGQKLIDNGISKKPKGQLVKVSDLSVSLKVNDEDGKSVSNLEVVRLPDDEFNWYGKNKAQTGDGNTDDSGDDSDSSDDSDSNDSDDEDKDDAAVLTRPLTWLLAVPLMAMLLA